MSSNEEHSRTEPIQRIRVCQVLYTGLGGHGSVAFSLLNAQQARCWTPIMAFIGSEPLLDSYAIQCKKLGVRKASFEFEQGKPYLAWWRLWRYLRQERPDAIVLHGVTSLLPCAVYCISRRIRLVSVEHTPVSTKSRREHIFSILAQFFADSVVCLLPNTREELLQSLGIFGRPEKCVVVPNGVDPSIFYPEKKGLSRLIRIGMAARFTKHKRQDILVEAMQRLEISRPDLPIVVSLAGSGPNVKTIREKRHNSRYRNYLELKGLLAENELAEWLRSLDIYVHATEAENMPTSILQAMATRLPIIASDIPPLRSLLSVPKLCGVLVRNDADELANAIASLIDDPATSQRLAEAGGDIANSAYNNEVMFTAYDRLLRPKK